MPHTLQGQCALAADVQAWHPLLEELDCAMSGDLITGEGVRALAQSHEPASLGVLSRKLARDPE